MKKSTSKPPKPQAQAPGASTLPAAQAKGKRAKDDEYDAAYYKRKRLQMAMAALVVGMIVISMVITIVAPFFPGR